MNARILGIHTQGGRKIGRAQGEPFVYQGKPYNCVASQGQLTVEMMVAGYTRNQDFTLVATKAQFSAAPLEKKEITFRGKTLIIRSVDEDLNCYTLVAGKR